MVKSKLKEEPTLTVTFEGWDSISRFRDLVDEVYDSSDEGNWQIASEIREAIQ